MIEPRDVKVFTGTMDQDTEARYLKEGNYRYLLNARNAIGTQGSFGAIEDVMGNSLVLNSYIRRGINKVIGSYEDIAGQSCIYFLYNSNGYHGIFRWYANRVGFPNGFIEKIYQVADPAAYDQFNPNPLNFQENNLITGINLVDNLLYWTDNFNSPKMINIERANETNKKRKFRLYINNNLFNTTFVNPLVNTINLYQENIALPIASFTWSMNLPVPNNRRDFVQNTYNNYLLSGFNAFATMYDRVDYLEVEVNNPGVYTLEWTNNAAPIYYSADIIPENFYPDATNTTVSYPAMSAQLIERIKYPPKCDPICTYDSTTGSAFQYDLTPYSVSWPLPGGGFGQTNIFGVTNIVSDPDNVLNPGPAVVNNSIPPVPPINAAGYISNTSSDNKTVFYTINIQLTITSAAVGAAYICVGPRIAPVLANSNVIWSWNLANYPVGNYNLILSGYANVPANSEICFWVGSALIGMNITGTVYGQMYVSGRSNNIVNTYPSFRAKYIYKDFQNSVYGAISPTLTSQNIYQDIISVNFDDLRLTAPELSCDIKNVILSVSLDNNTTWFDFANLKPFEYSGYNSRIYDYNGLEVLLPVSPEEAILPYHNVPKKSKSQEYIDDRIWDGSIVTGYDQVSIKMQINIDYESTAVAPILPYTTIDPPSSISRWRRGWTGYVGIVYYDDADRKSPVCIDKVNGYVSIPSYNEDVAPQTKNFNPAFLRTAIYSAPPDWATKYQFVRSDDLSQQTYLLWGANNIQFVDDNDVVVPFLNSKYIKIDLQNITYYNDNTKRGSQIAFTFQPGDRIKFISDGSLNIYQDNDFVISSVLGNVIYVVNDYSVQPSTNALLELYTPRSESSKLNYYEFGECYDIYTINQAGVDIKAHKGNIQDQTAVPSTNFALAAVSELMTGDVWYRKRYMYYNVSLPTPPFYNAFISSNTPSDTTYVVYENNGRVNSEDIKGELYQPTAIVFSDRYISNTEINGLAAVQPLNTEQYSTVYGPINKMQVVNNDVLKLVFGNSYQLSIYVSQGVIRQSQGGPALVSVADQVAGNSHIIQRTLGTINAESVLTNDEADMFGYDENEGVVWVSSGNGLIQISDRGMKSIFKKYSNERKALGLPSETPAVYDLYHDEYIITLGTINNAPNAAKVWSGVTIAYNKQKQGWTSYYSFVPEYYGRVRDYVVSFKDGDLWVHDRNQLSKNFYGTQYTRQLTYISNKDFPKVKDYKAVSVNGIGANSAPTIRILPFQGYLSGMLSSLSTRFFKTLEGVQYAYFQKDKLSPGFGGNQLQALANGRNLKGQVIEVTLENTDTAKSIIYSSDIIYFYSEHS